MTDQLTTIIDSLISSPGFYPVLILIIIADCLVPLIPSETIISIAGAWSGSVGVPNMLGILFTATAAAIVGDNLLYFFGSRLYGLVARTPGNSKRGKALTWTRKNLNNHDVSTIIIARFIPWARWFVTLTLASVGYSYPRFLLWDSIGALLWATQATLLGYLGGWLFQDQPLFGLILGASLGIVMGLVFQQLQRLWDRKRAASGAVD